MATHQGCPQTPGGRIRALGFASTRTRGRRRGPIPSGLDGDTSRLPSDAGRAHPRPWLRVHEDAGPPRGPRTGDVSLSGLAGMTPLSFNDTLKPPTPAKGRSAFWILDVSRINKPRRETSPDPPAPVGPKPVYGPDRAKPRARVGINRN